MPRRLVSPWRRHYCAPECLLFDSFCKRRAVPSTPLVHRFDAVALDCIHPHSRRLLLPDSGVGQGRIRNKMSLRRFVNLVVEESRSKMYSLRRIDLLKRDFFYDTAPPPQQKLVLEKLEFFLFPSTEHVQLRHLRKQGHLQRLFRRLLPLQRRRALHRHDAQPLHAQREAPTSAYLPPAGEPTALTP